MVMCNMLEDNCIKNELNEDDGAIPELVGEDDDPEGTPPPGGHSSNRNLLFSFQNVNQMSMVTVCSDDSGGQFSAPNYSGLELASPGQVGHSYERYDATIRVRSDTDEEN